MGILFLQSHWQRIAAAILFLQSHRQSIAVAVLFLQLFWQNIAATFIGFKDVFSLFFLPVEKKPESP